MTSVEIYSDLTEMFREQFRDPGLVLSPAMTHDDVPGWDSASTVAIIMAIEERYDIELSARDLKEFHSVGDLATIIQRHQG